MRLILATADDDEGHEQHAEGGEDQQRALRAGERPGLVVGGQPSAGARTLTFVKGERVAFEVVSDVADEIHVHGYDLRKDVAPGATARYAFKATIEGRFEIELENAGTLIATLEVAPS